MSDKKRLGLCAMCGRQMPIFSRGLCRTCHKHAGDGVPEVDCFAYKPNITNGQCDVTGGPCLMKHGQACGFHRTKADHAASRARAVDRIRTLPEAQMLHITETYLMQKEGDR